MERLIELMESRIRRNVYVRFGGEHLKTYHSNMERRWVLSLHNIDIDKDYTTYFKDSVVVLDQKYEINFQNNYYFYAIPNKHLETNSKLEQTLDWDNGTFNPYE